MTMWLHVITIACLTTCASSAVRTPGSFGHRGPPRHVIQQQQQQQQPGCNLGRLCAGPANSMYPVFGGTRFESTFVVPPLPCYFDMSMTYYDYFNIFFDRVYRPVGAKFNQFVPQLMLGTALANSSGPPHYTPHWMELQTWHFGAQYFMGIYSTTNNDNGNDDWRGAAAVGELHPVEPGEWLRTTMSLSQDATTWTLTMSVVGDASRTSTVIADKPFMGLLNTTTMSWLEYNATTVGSCWENYNMVNESSYPEYWHQVHVLTSPKVSTGEDWWSFWETGPGDTGNCSTKPLASVYSYVSHNKRIQKAFWDIQVKDHQMKILQKKKQSDASTTIRAQVARP